MDLNLLRIITTLASFAVFIGIVAWALAPANRSAFDTAARIPLADDDRRPEPGKGV